MKKRASIPRRRGRPRRKALWKLIEQEQKNGTDNGHNEASHDKINTTGTSFSEIGESHSTRTERIRASLSSESEPEGIQDGTPLPQAQWSDPRSHVTRQGRVRLYGEDKTALRRLKRAIPVPGRFARKCLRCGQTYERIYSQSQRKFCSSNCWYEWRKTQRILRNLKCPQCGKEFQVGTAHPARKFCSAQCFQRAGRRLYTCRFCSKEFSRPAHKVAVRFCSLSCSNKSRQKEFIPKTCIGCGKSFRRLALKWQRTAKYCTRECRDKYCRGPQNPLFRGNRRHYRGSDWKEQAAAARRDCRDRCQCCKKRPKQKLSVDHIVPFRLAFEICQQRPHLSPNDLINLIGLCRSCHGKKTPTERKILSGDIIGFIASIKMVVPQERLIKAMQLYGLHS